MKSRFETQMLINDIWSTLYYADSIEEALSQWNKSPNRNLSKFRLVVITVFHGEL
jgi:hypothetical protein